MKNNPSPNWDHIVAQIEEEAVETQFGEINLTFKVRNGKVVGIENVEVEKRTWIHLQPKGNERG